MSEYTKPEGRARIDELLERLKEIDPDTLTELVYATRGDAPDGGFKKQFQKDPWSDIARPLSFIQKLLNWWRF